MDPRKNLEEQLRLAQRARASDDEEFNRLGELVIAFSQWATESGALPEPEEPPPPMQPVVLVAGAARFKKNRIVRFLLDTNELGLNKLERVPGFRTEDWEQFHQLIGYSVSGYQELYPTSDTCARAEEEATRLLSRA